MAGDSKLKLVTSTAVRATLSEILNDLEFGDAAYLIERRSEPIALLLDVVDGLDELKDGPLKERLRDELARIYGL